MIRSRVIGLSGLKGSGKDTVANYLADEHGFRILSFADALKDVTGSLWNLPRPMLEGDSDVSRKFREEYKHPANGKTPRQLLQEVGVAMREVDPHVWVNYVRTGIDLSMNNGRDVVVTDVRFPNEMDMIQYFGQMWRVVPAANKIPLWYNDLIETCGNMDFRQEATPGALNAYFDEHISETLLSLPTAESEMDAVIDNDSDFENLFQQIDEKLNECNERSSPMS